MPKKNQEGEENGGGREKDAKTENKGVRGTKNPIKQGKHQIAKKSGKVKENKKKDKTDNKKSHGKGE